MVKGLVLQQESKPVDGSTITLLKDNNVLLQATSAKDGAFVFSGIKNKGSYILRATYVGLESQPVIIEVGEAVTSTTIVMKTQTYVLEPLEITSLRASDKAPFTKTNLAKTEIEKYNLGQDLPFLLNQTPSVVINSDAGNGVGYTGIRIRGSDATRINVTLNGIPYNDAESQGTYFVDLPDIASSLSSIQIQRGVGTSSNGAGAFGGTINLSTNEINNKSYGEFNNGYGSFNTWKHTVKAGSGLISDHFTVDARLSKISSNGFIDRAATSLKSLYLSTAYVNKNTSLRFNIISGKEKTYQAWNGIDETTLKTNRTFNSAGTEKPGVPYNNETDNYQQDHYQLFFNHSLTNKFSFNTAVFLTKGAGYYEQYKAGVKFSSYGLPDAIVGTSTVKKTDIVRQLWLDNRYYGQIASMQYKDAKNQVNIGGGWNTYDGDHFGKIIWAQVGVPKDYRWYNLNAKKTDKNLYAKWQYTINNSWLAFADLQYRHVQYSIGGFRNNPMVNIDRRFNFINPKVGITFSANGWQAYLSYALGNKEPNRDDFEAGIKQQPKHETLHDFELGIEKRQNNFMLSATAYFMKYINQLVLTGKINDVGAYTRINIPDSYRLGLELQGTSNIAEWLNVAGNLTLSRNKIKQSAEYVDDYDNGGQKITTHNNKDIAFSPSVVGAFTANISPIKNVEISLPAKYVGRQYLDNTEDRTRSLNPYFVQDAKVTWSIREHLFKQLNLIAQVNNVFNKKYEPNGYTYSYFSGGSNIAENYYYPMAGTNFMVGLNVKL